MIDVVRTFGKANETMVTIVLRAVACVATRAVARAVTRITC
jgi:hypothetical protein